MNELVSTVGTSLESFADAVASAFEEIPCDPNREGLATAVVTRLWMTKGGVAGGCSTTRRSLLPPSKRLPHRKDQQAADCHEPHLVARPACTGVSGCAFGRALHEIGRLFNTIPPTTQQRVEPACDQPGTLVACRSRGSQGWRTELAGRTGARGPRDVDDRGYARPDGLSRW
jgi:hypothetical protein